jgi:hypothetical protein
VRLPPALAASATPRIVELLGEPPARVLELDFAGIHAVPLALAGFDVVVVETDPRHRERALARVDKVLDAVPPEDFDAVVAHAGADLMAVSARKVVLVGQDGAVWSSGSS